jgi:hypothetical protein
MIPKIECCADAIDGGSGAPTSWTDASRTPS